MINHGIERAPDERVNWKTSAGFLAAHAVVLLTFNLFENRQRAVTAEQGALQTELQNIESVIRNASHETVLAATLIAQRPDATLTACGSEAERSDRDRRPRRMATERLSADSGATTSLTSAATSRLRMLTCGR